MAGRHTSGWQREWIRTYRGAFDVQCHQNFDSGKVTPRQQRVVDHHETMTSNTCSKPQAVCDVMLVSMTSKQDAFGMITDLGSL